MDTRDEPIRNVFLCYLRDPASQLYIASNGRETQDEATQFLDWFAHVANRDSLICYRTRNSSQRAKMLESEGIIRHRTTISTKGEALSKRRSIDIESELPVALSPIQNTAHLSVGDGTLNVPSSGKSKELSPRNGGLRLSGGNLLSPVRNLELTSPHQRSSSTHAIPSSNVDRTQHHQIAVSPCPSNESIVAPHDLKRKLSPTKSNPKLESLNLKKRPRLPIEDDADDHMHHEPHSHKKLQPITRKVKKRKTKATMNISPQHAAEGMRPVKLNSMGASPKSNSSLRLPPLQQQSMCTSWTRTKDNACS